MLLLPLTVWLCGEIARSQLVEAQCNGGDSCCSLLNQCGKGEGDCDNHTDCEGELQCGRDNCKLDVNNGFDQTDDCCFDPMSADAAGILSQLHVLTAGHCVGLGASRRSVLDHTNL